MFIPPVSHHRPKFGAVEVLEQGWGPNGVVGLKARITEPDLARFNTVGLWEDATVNMDRIVDVQASFTTGRGDFMQRKHNGRMASRFASQRQVEQLDTLIRNNPDIQPEVKQPLLVALRNTAPRVGFRVPR